VKKNREDVIKWKNKKSKCKGGRSEVERGVGGKEGTNKEGIKSKKINPSIK